MLKVEQRVVRLLKRLLLGGGGSDYHWGWEGRAEPEVPGLSWDENGPNLVWPYGSQEQWMYILGKESDLNNVHWFSVCFQSKNKHLLLIKDPKTESL